MDMVNKNNMEREMPNTIRLTKKERAIKNFDDFPAHRIR